MKKKDPSKRQRPKTQRSSFIHKPIQNIETTPLAKSTPLYVPSGATWGEVLEQAWSIAQPHLTDAELRESRRLDWTLRTACRLIMRHVEENGTDGNLERRAELRSQATGALRLGRIRGYADGNGLVRVDRDDFIAFAKKVGLYDPVKELTAIAREPGHYSGILQQVMDVLKEATTLLSAVRIASCIAEKYGSELGEEHDLDEAQIRRAIKTLRDKHKENINSGANGRGYYLPKNDT